MPNAGAFGKVIAPASGSVFAFQVLPTVIFISAFLAVLYHIGLMQIIIRGFAWVMLKNDAHLRRGEHEPWRRRSSAGTDRGRR